MTEQLLHGSQVGPALEQVGGRAVPQPVGSDVGRPGHLGDATVDERPHGSLVDPATPGTDEEGGPGAVGHEAGTAGREPAVDRPRGWVAERHAALLAALAEHPDEVALPVDVAEVEGDELTDADARRVEQLEHGRVAHPDRVVVVSRAGRSTDQLGGLVGT